MNPPRPISIRGGPGGIKAHCEDLDRLAVLFGSAARYCLAQSVDLHGYLVHPALLESAALDPWGFGDVEARLLGVLDGPGGLSWLGARCAGLAVDLRATAIGYDAADRLDAHLVPALRGLWEIARSVPGGLPPLTMSGADGYAAAHPEVADLAVDVVTAFWSDRLLLDLVAAWPDGRPQLTRVGTDRSPAARRPPRCLRDVVSGLSLRDHRPTGGDVDVRFVTSTGADGHARRRVIVDIPGTKNWSASPRQTDPTSLGTNLRVITGGTTTYGRGVIEALRRAGVARTEPVLLVGHSQGGLVALDVARQVQHGHEFNVTHVVTAGAPVARVAVPASIQLLAIENDGDVIPHCDGADNPDRTNETTAKAHRNSGDAVINHDLDRSYVPAAGDVDASSDPSARAYLAGLHPFLSGTSVRTEVFHIERSR